jgi:hypothetical protein
VCVAKACFDATKFFWLQNRILQSPGMPCTAPEHHLHNLFYILRRSGLSVKAILEKSTVDYVDTSRAATSSVLGACCDRARDCGKGRNS